MSETDVPKADGKKSKRGRAGNSTNISQEPHRKSRRRRGELSLQNHINQRLQSFGIVHDGVTQAIMREIMEDQENAQRKADKILLDAKRRADEILASAKTSALEKALEPERVVKKLADALASAKSDS